MQIKFKPMKKITFDYVWQLETWKDIQGFEGFYQISTSGLVRSVSREIAKTNGTSMRIRERLKASRKRNGYSFASLWVKGVQSSISIHRLVACAFIPNPENKPHINHINGVRDDNRVENLEWCTQGENMAHAHRRDIFPNRRRPDRKGENSTYKKLTADQVREIRQLSGSSTQVDMAARFGVSIRTIYKICNRVSWANI